MIVEVFADRIRDQAEVRARAVLIRAPARASAVAGTQMVLAPSSGPLLASSASASPMIAAASGRGQHPSSPIASIASAATSNAASAMARWPVLSYASGAP